MILDSKEKLIASCQREKTHLKIKYEELIDKMKKDFQELNDRQEEAIREMRVKLHNTILECENGKSVIKRLESKLEQLDSNALDELNAMNSQLEEERNMAHDFVSKNEELEKKLRDLKVYYENKLEELNEYYVKELEESERLIKNQQEDLKKYKNNQIETENKFREKIAMREGMDDNFDQMEKQYDQLKGDYMSALQSNDNLIEEKASLLELLKDSNYKLELLKKTIKENEGEIFNLNL